MGQSCYDGFRKAGKAFRNSMGNSSVVKGEVGYSPVKLPNLTHMKNSYQTINKPVVVETIIKKSRFITSASPVKDAEEAGRFLSTIRERHSQANHNVFAYVIDERIQRYSDDGEPGGTAGKPVLDLIKQKSLTRIIIVVTRYFGGIKVTGGQAVLVEGGFCYL